MAKISTRDLLKENKFLKERLQLIYKIASDDEIGSENMAKMLGKIMYYSDLETINKDIEFIKYFENCMENLK